MERTRYHAATDCPITATIDVIGGKWKPILIYLLLEGPLRFGELHRIVPGIALKVLSRQLKELEEDGIVSRTVYAEVPPRVEYALTEKGESLREIMLQLSQWSSERLLKQRAAAATA
ncbi:MAG TPA: helix-turn-helix domain-containing protein [Dinghuibacter sp.]|jgi:DNA-binding HxlR family transcriptional regulator|uniref:winged helix-turn-helix transcriptional regulator n=1 Tax=Dinghuibacter sp. TaxID=2024697 RepID=UPI002BDB8914|nr:helix-turn-helix domain-containing protein [Dinghuibacter sp.]HTJ13027.1 helix-turn-helix domain-containing protein [Dinghuibacter sp.]